MRISQELFQRRVIDGQGVKKTLAKFAAEPVQIGTLAGRLDPFGNHLEIQVVRKRDNETRYFPAFDILLNVANERPVDLQHVPRKAAQATQRGVAGPKVVNAQPNARIL